MLTAKDLARSKSYVNHLEESDFQKKETLGVLRQLRLNVSLNPIKASDFLDSRYTAQTRHRQFPPSVVGSFATLFLPTSPHHVRRRHLPQQMHPRSIPRHPPLLVCCGCPGIRRNRRSNPSGRCHGARVLHERAAECAGWDVWR